MDPDTEYVVLKRAFLDAHRMGLSKEEADEYAFRRLKHAEYGPVVDSTAVEIVS